VSALLLKSATIIIHFNCYSIPYRTLMLFIVLHCIKVMIVIIDDYCTSDWLNNKKWLKKVISWPTCNCTCRPMHVSIRCFPKPQSIPLQILPLIIFTMDCKLSCGLCHLNLGKINEYWIELFYLGLWFSWVSSSPTFIISSLSTFQSTSETKGVQYTCKTWYIGLNALRTK